MDPSLTLIRVQVPRSVVAVSRFGPQSPAAEPAQPNAAGGNHRSFIRNGIIPKIEINDPLQAHVKLFSKYTDDEIHNLTAYLVTLK